MTAIKRRRRVVLQAKLDRSGDGPARRLRRYSQAKIDPRCNAARCDEATIPDDASLLVNRSDEREEVNVGPMRRGATAIEKSGRTEQERSRADGCHVARLAAQFLDEGDGLAIGKRGEDTDAAGHAQQIEPRT